MEEYEIDGLIYKEGTPHSRIEEILYQIEEKMDEEDDD